MTKILSTIIFLVAAAMVGNTIWQTFFDKSRKASHAHAGVEQLLGQHFAMPEVAQNSETVVRQASLVLVIAANCQYCERSAPFYRRLSEMRAKTPGFHLIAVFPEGQAGGDAYLAQRLVHADRILARNLPSIGVQGTPTLLLLNGDTIEAAWPGLLDSRRETEVISKLNAACANCLSSAAAAAGR